MDYTGSVDQLAVEYDLGKYGMSRINLSYHKSLIPWVDEPVQWHMMSISWTLFSVSPSVDMLTFNLCLREALFAAFVAHVSPLLCS